MLVVCQHSVLIAIPVTVDRISACKDAHTHLMSAHSWEETQMPAKAFYTETCLRGADAVEECLLMPITTCTIMPLCK